MGQVCHAITNNDKDVQASWSRAEIDRYNPDLHRQRYRTPTLEEEEISKEEESDFEEDIMAVTVKGTIEKARGLRNADWGFGGKSDPYCEVKYKGKVVHKTKTINDNLDPVWNEDFSIDDFIEGESLEFLVWDEDLGDARDDLGYAVVDYDVFRGSGFSGEIQLQDAGKGNSAHLHLRIKVGSAPHKISGDTHKHEFDVTIDKRKDDTGLLGLQLDSQDGKTAYITEIEDGETACNKYNDDADLHKEGHTHHIRKGDFIVRVNEKKDNSHDMLEELKQKERVSISIKRPVEIKVDVVREGDDKNLPLGLHFRDPAGYSLIITKVDENSAVDNWNKGKGTAKKKYKLGNDTLEDTSLKIQEGDRIIAVAGFAAKAGDLHRRICLPNEHVSFTVVRPT